MTWPSWLSRDSPPILALAAVVLLGHAFEPVRRLSGWLWGLFVALNVRAYRALRNRASKREMELIAKIPGIEQRVGILMDAVAALEALREEVTMLRAEVAAMPAGAAFAQLAESVDRTERTVARLAQNMADAVGDLTRLLGDEARRQRIEGERR